MAKVIRRAAILVVAAGCVWSLTACNTDTETEPALTPDQREALARELGTDGKKDGWGLTFYSSRYSNLVLAGESDRGDVALVAGSHDADFPYWRSRPWDNGLLLVADKAYHFTQRTQGVALQLEIDTDGDEEQFSGRVRYRGEMERAADGAKVAVLIDLPLAVLRFEARQLGKRYNFLDIDEVPGLRWQPFSLSGSTGTVQIGDEPPLPVRGLHGELERGVLSNLRSTKFGIAYDYVCVARAGAAGYAFVDFVSHPLIREGTLGELLDWYLVESASETLTLDASEQKGNRRGVVRPLQSNADVTLAENRVDLGPASLRRQLILTHDAQGANLYGLREIFERK